MIEELYENLTMTEQDSFKRIINLLLAQTYVVQEKYDFNNNMSITNPDYLFIIRNYELISEYLMFSGFILHHDTNYGVISLSSEFEYNRERFDKLTTVILYSLRLIYEEEREKLSLIKEIMTTTGELIHKMLSLGVIKKKPSDRDLHKSFVLLSKFQVVIKVDGTWESAETKICILPTILFIVTNERISNMYTLLGDATEEEVVEEDE